MCNTSGEHHGESKGVEGSIIAPKLGCGQAIGYSLHESRSNVTVMAPVTKLRRTV